MWRGSDESTISQQAGNSKAEVADFLPNSAGKPRQVENTGKISVLQS